MGYFNLLNFPSGIVPITKMTTNDIEVDKREFPVKDMWHKAMKYVSMITYFLLHWLRSTELSIWLCLEFGWQWGLANCRAMRVAPFPRRDVPPVDAWTGASCRLSCFWPLRSQIRVTQHYLACICLPSDALATVLRLCSCCTTQTVFLLHYSDCVPAALLSLDYIYTGFAYWDNILLTHLLFHSFTIWSSAIIYF